MKNALVLTNGTFRKGAHEGHVGLFQDALKLGDRLVVFIDDKERVAQLKPGAFCKSNEDRLLLVKNQKQVYDAEIFSDEAGLKTLIEKHWFNFSQFCKDCQIHPSNLIYIKGGDYNTNDITVKSFVESLGGVVVTLGYNEKYSTTKQIEELQGKK